MERDYVTIELSDGDYSIADYFARNARLGGRSQVYSDQSQRMATLNENQLTGQVCTMAFHLWRYGNVRQYVIMRRMQDKAPMIGDEGWDVPKWDLPIDVKGSEIRTKRRLDQHWLWVRGNEYHERWNYVLALHRRPRVYLVGWATSEMLAPDRYGRFGLIGEELYPMGELAEAQYLELAMRMESDPVYPYERLVEVFDETEN